MPTDVKLDQVNGNYIILEASVIKATSTDVLIDAPTRRQGGGPLRRALVHDQSDGLTINYNGDYPGGVTINGLKAIGLAKAAIGSFPTLIIHGGITYEAPGIDIHGHAANVTVSLESELGKLQAQISDLTARVKALETH